MRKAVGACLGRGLALLLAAPARASPMCRSPQFEEFDVKAKDGGR